MDRLETVYRLSGEPLYDVWIKNEQIEGIVIKYNLPV